MSSWPLRRLRRNLSLRSCLADTGRVLVFMAERVFLPMGKAWLLHIADAPRTGTAGDEWAKGWRTLLYKLLSCHKIGVAFHKRQTLCLHQRPRLHQSCGSATLHRTQNGCSGANHPIHIPASKRKLLPPGGHFLAVVLPVT